MQDESLQCFSFLLHGNVLSIQGNTQNFSNPWENSSTSIGSLIGGFLPGFASYVGWYVTHNPFFCHTN